MKQHALTAHATEARLVARALEVSVESGLAQEEAARRLQLFGPNLIPVAPGRSIATMFREQIFNLVALLLVAAAVLSWIGGEVLQAAAIGAVLLLNALVGVATEWQSGRALEALRNEVRTTATIRRDGTISRIDAESLVVGDVVLLTAGDRVPADLRLMEAASLRSVEAALTGESTSVQKSVAPARGDAPVAERASMLYLGTLIAAGRGTGVVVATGAETEMGRIGRLVGAIETEPTLLQKRLDQLGRRLVYFVLAIGALITTAGVLRGEPLLVMLETGLSLAVAAVPEALPAVTTFILAFGVLRMARKNAIVRRLSAVETLGSITVICSDKTGTLTLNEMTVAELRLAGGGEPEGTERREMLELSVLCNEATRSEGDPTEIALVVAAEAAAIDVALLRRNMPRLGEEPFDAKTRRMVTVHQGVTIMKGAPGEVIDAVIAAGGATADDRESLQRINHDMAERGLRVLALAADRNHKGYRLVGFIGMNDPPRPGVLEAVAAAHAAGIRVVMLTGDQVDTARAISRALGIGDRVRHASEIESVSSEDLPALVEHTDAFARVAPEEKYRIVEALQRSGEIVAVTGDGVNDAPALKKADVGVAMGARGTEVAKEAAGIVLADDDFTTIVAAIAGGRTIYANIIRFVHMMFSQNLSEVLTIFGALILGWPLPLLPLQILWINLATDVFPAFALALEPGSPRSMQRGPRDPKAPLFSSALIGVICWQSLMLATLTMCAYQWATREYGVGAHARTVAMLVLIAVQLGHTFNCRSRTRSMFDGLFSNPHLFYATATVIALQAILFSSARLMSIVGIVRPEAVDLEITVAASLTPIVIVEIVKWLGRRK